MPESAASTARLTEFSSQLTPSLATVKAALTAAGGDTDHPRACDLYQRDIDCHNLGTYRMLVLLADVVTEYGTPARRDTVLDLGCGIGGPGRFLAERFGCSVLGVDVLPLRVERAESLTNMTGLSDEW